jgi:hypothetical protein
MRKSNAGVIQIRRDISLSDADQKVVDVAFDLWLARGFRGGSPEEDLLAAMRDAKGAAPAGLFLVTRRRPMGNGVRPLTVMQPRLREGPK